MSSWLQAFNPTSPITTEPEAERAARASAVAMFIGAAVGLAGVAWTIANPGELQAAMASAAQADPDASAAAEMGAQVGLWLAGGLAVLQLILGFVQWRNPGKVLAIIFLLLVLFGVVSTAATPLLSGAVPNVPVPPTWQIVVSLVVLAIQTVLLIAGLRGIGRLDRFQMDGAR